VNPSEVLEILIIARVVKKLPRFYESLMSVTIYRRLDGLFRVVFLHCLHPITFPVAPSGAQDGGSARYKAATSTRKRKSR
jgi:hypothetical protein